MIIVRMIQYWNDYHKKELREQFRSLKELADWIFDQMRADYTHLKGGSIYFHSLSVTQTGTYTGSRSCRNTENMNSG